VGLGRHEVADRPGRVDSLADHPVKHVAFGQDARQAPVLAHEQCLAAMFAHRVQGAGERRLGADHRRLSPADRTRQRGAQLEPAHARAGPAGLLGVRLSCWLGDRLCQPILCVVWLGAPILLCHVPRAARVVVHWDAAAMPDRSAGAAF
jgi:hypothetical protein